MEEKVLFKNKFEYTEEIINKVLKENEKKALIKLGFDIVICLIISFIYYIIKQESALLIYVVVIGVICLFLPKFLIKMSFKRTILSLGEKPWNIEIWFYENRIETKRKNNNIELKYENIKKYSELNDIIILFFSGNIVVPIKKDSFEKNDCKEFIKFLKNKKK